MRVLFTVSAWKGHWYPLVPLGWALQASGHEVRVACAPSQSEDVARAGLTPVPVLGELDMVFLARLQNVWNAQAGRWPYAGLPPHPVTGAPLGSLSEFSFAEFARESGVRLAAPTRVSHDAAVDLARRWRPDLVVHELLSMEGLLAARVLGVPAVLHLWGPAGTHEDEPGLRLRPEDPTGSFARYGVGELGPDLVEHVIDPCPGALRPRTSARRLPMRYVPYNGPGHGGPGYGPGLDGYLDGPVDGPITASAGEPAGAARPRVCVVWGNSVARMVGPQAAVLPTVVEAVAGLDAEVVVTASAADAAALGPLPPNVRVLRDQPLHQVLPGCAAVVHHGGAGVLMTALAAGVPQLALPCAMDQFLNARRLAGSGAGLAVPAHEAGVARIREAVTALLGRPAHRTAAEELRREIVALPSPLRLVEDLEKLAAR
ncbi:nucleotide disphospho-sugar-binding domain-containing protein [Streptomyces sp. Caat 7-52]|uniref:nucleotide disphospho-sugar-binding domain-containing protein n=1 Tax=Streptomyces sp. Caat 7-52 TaxID=2949637 RepID=UPI002035A84F|nr:nucleotide disphospho-sugar-binding domain-containing protein [Streptomyces sp. Caat 7-52]